MDNIDKNILAEDVADLEERLTDGKSGTPQCTHILITAEQAERYLVLAQAYLADAS